jgi:hypothetical protein
MEDVKDEFEELRLIIEKEGGDTRQLQVAQERK